MLHLFRWRKTNKNKTTPQTKKNPKLPKKTTHRDKTHTALLYIERHLIILLVANIYSVLSVLKESR